MMHKLCNPPSWAWPALRVLAEGRATPNYNPPTAVTFLGLGNRRLVAFCMDALQKVRMGRQWGKVQLADLQELLSNEDFLSNMLVTTDELVRDMFKSFVYSVSIMAAVRRSRVSVYSEIIYKYYLWSIIPRP